MLLEWLKIKAFGYAYVKKIIPTSMLFIIPKRSKNFVSRIPEHRRSVDDPNSLNRVRGWNTRIVARNTLRFYCTLKLKTSSFVYVFKTVQAFTSWTLNPTFYSIVLQKEETWDSKLKSYKKQNGLIGTMKRTNLLIFFEIFQVKGLIIE